MELNLQAAADVEGTNVVSLSDTVFGVDYKPALIHQAVVAYLAGARSGTHAQKSRSGVSGSTAKPWRQKGTGRARAGSIRSPLWRGGGVTFAAVSADYSQKLNRKMYRGAIRSILSELIRQERLVAVETFSVTTPKTRDLVAKLKSMGDSRILILTDELDANLVLAARNLHKVQIATASVDPVSLMWADKVIATAATLKQFEERLG